MRNFLFSLIALSGVVASPAIAGPDEDVRDAARAEAIQLRSDGWPQERCSLGVSFFGNTVAVGNGEILAGDELLYIGDVGVEGGSTAEILDTLGTIPPGSVLTMQVQRDGAAVNIEQTCGNIADYQRVYLEALDFASRKKWYDCIDALAGRP